jgi:cobalt-zinc-cadmium efflux system outer membrane protein
VRGRVVIPAAVVFVLTTVAAAAQNGADAALPTQVTLDQVLTIMNARSPRIAADRAALAIAEADRVTAQTLPNPSVSYGGTHLLSGLSTGAVTQHQFVLDQPLLISHQREAREAAADLNLAAARARVDQTLAERRVTVRQAFATLLSRQQQLEVSQQSLADLERVLQVVRVRADAGERSRYDVARVDTETEALRVDIMNAEADVEDAAGQLATLLGLPGWSPRAVGTLSPGDVPTESSQLWDIATTRRPALVALRQQQAASRGGIVVARRERLPVPVLSGGAQLTQDVTGTSAVFGLSLPLPVFDKNQGAIAKAEAQLDADGLALTAELEEAHAEVDRAAKLLRARREALIRLEGGVVQRVPILRQMAEDAYREGSGDILDLLDAMRSQRTIQLSHVQQLESVKLAEETVRAVTGLD